MSIYTDCSAAIQKLLADDSLHSPDHKGFFTDLDVVAIASREAGGYSEDEIKEALVQSGNALGKLYVRGRIARYGPVRLPGLRDPDYARIATKIVHAHPEAGPTHFKTPNGTFSRLMVWKDKDLRSGRRFGINRNDLETWSPDDLQEWKLRAKMADLRRATA